MPTSRSFALGMAAAAWLVGLAIHWNNGYYSIVGLVLISAAIEIGGAACFGPPSPAIESLSGKAIVALLTAGIAIDALLIWQRTGDNRLVGAGVLCLGLLGALQAFDLRSLRVPLAGILLGLFWIVASVSIHSAPTPRIDVLMFQQVGAESLLQGQNPYTPRYPNLYGADTRFYGPGVVDAGNRLTVGLPYPPLSLLLSLPGYVLGGDSRYADITAMTVSAGLLLLSGPSRWTALIAVLLLLTPRVLFVIEYAWTEALFACAFSALMFSAIRWRRAMPYALGLFLATKQYSVFALPLVPLLVASDKQESAVRVIGLALAVAAAVTLPFFIWDPHAFWRSVVEFQFVQPLRTDALSHLVWLHNYFPLVPWQPAMPFVLLIGTMTVALWRSRPTPAYFAGAFGVAQLVFFAFSKQAFANYYFFVITTLCWAVAAASPVFDDEVEGAAEGVSLHPVSSRDRATSASAGSSSSHRTL